MRPENRGDGWLDHQPEVEVRPGTLADLEELNDLYNRYVAESPVTFDVEPTTMAWRAEWFAQHGPTGRHRVFVAIAGGRLVGFTSSSQLRPKAAYEPSVETSVYVSPEALGRGIGALLYGGLFEALENEHVDRTYGGIVLPNPASVRLHERFGFRAVGRFSEVGRRFDRYWDVAWYEKDLG